VTRSEFQDRWERSAGYVYFLAAGDPPIAIKIGITTQATLKPRVMRIQGSNHEPLPLLGVIAISDGERPMNAALQLEGELHRQFFHLQRFERGRVAVEWF
jgi:hypothetical protein